MSKSEGESARATASVKERKMLRRKTIQFVALFVISVLALLSAHTMLVHSRGNDLYLYQVARSTAFVLDLLGDSARVVGHHRTYPGQEAYIRASMEAWRRGEPEPDEKQFKGVEAEPLTPLESWEYSAMSQRRELAQLLKIRDEGGEVWFYNPFNQDEVQETMRRIQQLQSRELGPTVSFVLRRGVSSEITEVRQRMRDAHQNQHLTDEDRAEILKRERARMADLDQQRRLLSELAQVQREISDASQDETLSDEEQAERLELAQAQLAELEAQQKAAPKTVPNKLKDVSFTFVVVPDCGAIPTMVIFVAAVLAFPALWWKKLVGMALGIPLLYGINTIRLTVLAIIGAWDEGGAIFTFAHEYVWQAIYIIFVVVVWLAWVELMVRQKKG